MHEKVFEQRNFLPFCNLPERTTDLCDSNDLTCVQRRNHWCVVAGKSGSGHCPKEWTRSQWTANTLEKSEQKRERAIVKEWEKNVVAHDSSGLFLARGGGKRQMSDKFRWLRGVLMVSPVPRRVMSRSLTGSVKGEMRRKLVFLRHCVRAQMRACLCACVCVCANSVTKPSP